MEGRNFTVVGDPIRVLRNRAGDPIVTYYLVEFGGSMHGVGMFLSDDDFCAVAIVTDVTGKKILIENDEQQLPDINELKDLFKRYSWAFE